MTPVFCTTPGTLPHGDSLQACLASLMDAPFILEDGPDTGNFDDVQVWLLAKGYYGIKHDKAPEGYAIAVTPRDMYHHWVIVKDGEVVHNPDTYLLEHPLWYFITVEKIQEAYDSTADTLQHIKEVSRMLIDAAGALMRRAQIHDQSKLESPEKEIFDKFTPMLRDLTYGSDAYRQALLDMQPALEHHYKHNRHHPEHFPGGVNDMTLIDLIEMLVDWYAASMRHADGDICKSLRINKKRFGISDQLLRILENTMDQHFLKF